MEPASPHRRFPARRVVATIVATLIVLALIGGMVWQALPRLVAPAPPAPSAPASVPAPAPGPTQPPLPAALPVTLTVGGDLGRPVPFATKAGAGTILVTKATWTGTGDMPPAPGMAYLIVDVEFMGTAGHVQAGESTVLVQDAAGTRRFAAYGAGDAGTPDRVLKPGARLTGQIGFQLPAGDATLVVLDERGLDAALVAIPGP